MSLSLTPTLSPSLTLDSRGKEEAAVAQGQGSKGQEEAATCSTVLHEPDADSAEGGPASEEREGEAAGEASKRETRETQQTQGG